MRYQEIVEDIPHHDAFARWFGASKVVDAAGRPLVCYHGTFQDFHIFKPGSHFGDANAANVRLHNLRHDSGENHKLFGGHGGSVVPVYLRIENPLRIEDDGTLNNAEDIADAALNVGGITPEDHAYICDISHDAPKKRLYDVLEEHGYDGIVYQNTVEGDADSWVVFRPEQIKSVFNKGTFNPLKRSISEDFDRSRDLDPGEYEENFRHWFGDSVVTDEAGKPLTCYHGTYRDFDYFYVGSHFGDRTAAHVRIKNKEGDAASGANIMPVYLSIKRPLRIVDDGGLCDREDIGYAAFKAGAITKQEWHDDLRYTSIYKMLAAKGFDGIVYKNTVEGNGDSWVPFWKYQIKSVFNRGTWSKMRDNISETEIADHRMQRAHSMGFTIPAFHGTAAKFNEFSLEKGKPSMMGGHAPHFSDNKKEANGYAKDRRSAGEKANVIHVLLRVTNPLVIDMHQCDGIISPTEYEKIVGRSFSSSEHAPRPTGYSALRDLENAIGYGGDRKDHWVQVYSKLMHLGYDALEYINMMPDFSEKRYTKYVVFDPKNIRSINAEFNPAEIDSRNIFA